MDRVKEFIDDYIYYIFIGIIITLILLFISLFFFYSNKINNISDNNSIKNMNEQNSMQKDESTINQNNTSNSSTQMFVDIKGAIHRPGVYQISSDMRIIDVVHLAGNLSKSADHKHLNLSQKVNDQQMIYIPLKGEVKESNIDNNITNNLNSNSSARINLNTSDKDNLQKINGVGDKKATKIIDYREEHGNFKKIEDIKEVPGFGNKSFDNVKNDITV